MDVVARSTNGECLHPILFCDAAKIWPEPVPQIRGEPRFAIFRAPDAMNEATRERMHRRLVLSSVSDSIWFISFKPSVETLGYSGALGFLLPLCGYNQARLEER